MERESHVAIGQSVSGEEDDSEFQTAIIQELQTQRGFSSQSHLINICFNCPLVNRSKNIKSTII